MQTDSRDIADLNIIRSIALLKRAVCLQHTRSMMGPYIDIPGPEISAGSRMMSWFFDEYSKYKRFSPACVTGKVCSQPADLNMAVHGFLVCMVNVA